MSKSRSRRARKPRISPVVRTAELVGLPVIQVANDRFEHCDIVNFSNADSSTTQRSIGQTKSNKDIKDERRQTIRRVPKVKELYIRGVINQRELAACEWYVTQHEAERQRIKIAQLDSEGGRSSDLAFGHWPANRVMAPGLTDFEEARAAINPFLVALFERVVLYHRPLGRLTRSFRLAIAQLIERIEGKVSL